jgi:transcriptional regulator with XRE-family HTH domain
MDLRQFRKDNDLTQQEFCDIANKNDYGYILKRRTYSNYEQGKAMPDKARIVVLSTQNRIKQEKNTIQRQMEAANHYKKIDEMTKRVRNQKKFSLIMKLKALWFMLVHSWKDGDKE